MVNNETLKYSLYSTVQTETWFWGVQFMRSKYVDDFNHDDWASDYDADIQIEDNPIRTGYADLLAWIADHINQSDSANILDIGAGTGNLSKQIKSCNTLVCLDISKEMLKKAEPKLLHLKDVSWVVGDFLEFFDRNTMRFDYIISSYALHHLTEPEKKYLFSRIHSSLGRNGMAIFGDLMFENDVQKKAIIDKYNASGNMELVEEIEEEFFWNLDTIIPELQRIGFDLKIKRFSELSWGISAKMR